MNEQQLRQKLAGKRIAALRGRRGMTQRDLAAAIGVTQGAIDQWEQGRSVPRWPVLRQLAAALGVPAVKLVEPLVIDFGDLGERGEDEQDL